MPAARRVTDTIAAVIQGARAQYLQRVVYVEGDVSTTLEAHLEDANRLAAALRAKFDIRPGDRVAVLAFTGQRYIALWHAALLGHFTIVPLNFRLAGPEILELLVNAQAKVLVHDRELAELASQCSSTLTVPRICLETLYQPSLNALVPPLDISPDDVALIMYTSGTTGSPKGSVMTQRAAARMFERQRYYWDVGAADSCFYTTAALFHVSGIFATCGSALRGTRTVIAAAFDVDRLLEDSRRHHVTHIALVSVMIDRFLGHPDFREEEHQHIRRIMYGGSPMSQETINTMSRRLPATQLLQCYGMTEMFGAATYLTPEDHHQGGPRLRSVGRALPGVELRVRRDDGPLGAIGEAGEIELRSDSMLTEYWRNPQQTAAALVDGWFRSGDIGYIDEGGYIFVVDRSKDMIITGGENVYSAEVEHVIGSLPGVAQVAVIGVPSAAWGEQVHAIVVPHAGTILDAATLHAGIRQQLGAYKCPKSIEIRTEPLPLTGTNKINKRALRAAYR